MDEASVTTEQMRHALDDLDRVNRFLGGWSGSRALLEPRFRARRGRPVSILDVGGGSGAASRDLRRCAARWGVRASFVSLDVHAAVCDVAQASASGDRDIAVVRGDALRLPFADDSFDFAHAALFLHHFRDDAIGAILDEMRRVSREGVVVNDLHRHVVSYFAIRAIAALFRFSPVSRHDGPLSVRRGFRRSEVERWRTASGFEALGYRRRWPYRWLAWCFADGGTPDVRA
jgi:ubiquinone/menaquinone biosynthesis C-methylase UbiE